MHIHVCKSNHGGGGRHKCITSFALYIYIYKYLISQATIKKTCCMTWPLGLVGGLGDVQRGQCQATASWAKCGRTGNPQKPNAIWHILKRCGCQGCQLTLKPLKAPKWKDCVADLWTLNGIQHIYLKSHLVYHRIKKIRNTERGERKESQER